MKIILSAALLFSFTACDNNAQTNEPVAINDSPATVSKKDSLTTYIHTFTDTVLENKITAALLNLPFVKKSNAYIDSFSNHKHGLSFMLENPAENIKEISVQAGYNGDDRFETYYHFYVHAQTLEIKLYDPVLDKKLTVKEYLRTQK